MDALTKKRFLHFWSHKTRQVTVNVLKDRPAVDFYRNCFLCESCCEWPNMVNFSAIGASYVMTKWICQSCCVESGWVW